MRGNPWRSLPVHRLAVYTEHGLSPKLLDEFFVEAMNAGCRWVLDPFVGSGVVAVEAQRRCLGVVGVDANPWSLLLVRAKTTPVAVRRMVDWLREGLERLDWVEPLVPSRRLERYHEPVVLDRLARLRRLVEEAPETWRPLLLAVFASIASRYSRLKRSPAPRFRGDQGVPRGDPAADMLRMLEELLGDYASHRFCGPVTLVWADSTSWLPRRVCAAVTSPPFANNIDYIRHTMLELLWAGFARDSRGLGWLRSIQAPASEAAARSWKPASRRREHLALAEQIGGKRARGYRRFLLQYLYSMERHFQLLADALEWEAWYTIGDSILGGAYIPVHELLADAARRAGLEAELSPLGERYRPGRRLYLLRLRSRR